MAKPRGFLSKLLRRAPVIGDVLADIAVKYESVQTQIDTIIDGLRTGKDELLGDSLELERLYEQVQDAQLGVQRAAYLGELLWAELETGEEEERQPIPPRRRRLEAVVHRVAMRVQDLRTMEQVNTQFFVSIDMTVQNNDHLSDAITRTVTVTQSLLTVGLAIQSALANQKKILSAVQETQQYTSDMLAANAASIRAADRRDRRPLHQPGARPRQGQERLRRPDRRDGRDGRAAQEGHRVGADGHQPS